MKIRLIGAWALSYALLTLMGVGAAEKDRIGITDLLPLIPSCAVPCILQGVSAIPNALSDPVSTCQNASMQAPISACIQGVCSFADQAKVGVANSMLCEGVPMDRSRIIWLVAVSVAFGSIAIIAIGLRTYTKLLITKKISWDDWTILGAGILLAAVLGLNFFNVYQNGFGRHYWTLDISRVTSLLKVIYVAEIVYVVEITLIKVSILLFYLRVFPERWFRIACIITLVLVIMAGLGVLLPVFFQCSPVSGAWDRSIQAKCINVNLLTYAAGGIAVGLDLVILILPIPDLVRLNMSREKKVHVLFMFSLGSIACATSMIRLKFLAQFQTSTDLTWDNVIAIIVSIIEICVAMVCACLPAIRALLCHLFPSVFGFATPSSSNYDPRFRFNDFVFSGSSDVKRSDRHKKSPLSPTILQSTRHNSYLPQHQDDVTKSDLPEESAAVMDETRQAVRNEHVEAYNHDSDRKKENRKQSLYSSRYHSNSRNKTDATPEILNGGHKSTEHSQKVHISKSNVASKWEGRYNHRNSYLSPASTPQKSVGSADPESENYDLGTIPSRTESEESIFVLQGPRESDDENEERQIIDRQVQVNKDIEMKRLDNKTTQRQVADQSEPRDIVIQRGSNDIPDVGHSGNGKRPLRLPISVFNRNPPQPSP